MKHIIKYRWPIAILWVAVAVSLFVFAPNLQELVQEKGQITVPQGYTSQEAQALMEEMSSDKDSQSATSSSVLVFHDDEGLDQADKKQVAEAIDQLKKNQDSLQISDILDFRDDPAIEDQTVSDDGKTIMVPFQLSLEGQEINEARENIYRTVDTIDVEHHLTGEQMIQQDILDNSEEGLKKTEFITVGLILIILFVVFRSFVAPFIPLLTVGISYLAAQGIVSILADTVDFPLSTFTQIFMVAVMFGIGTDYCILLISRFKEEIARHDSIQAAVATTYRAGGKTIFFAGLAVLIGFTTIGLSTFSLYQSAVAVAVGVAVVLIALATLVPFFLVVLGKKLFWPFDKHVSHKESRIWGRAGKFAWARPVIALAIVAVITLPPVLSYSGDKSYNSLEEIGDKYGSVQAFNWIADSFGPGQTMPTQVVFKTDEPIETVEDYQAIEYMSQKLADMDGVDQVRSATRPAGEIIEDFQVEHQADLLADGIGQSSDGLTKIQEGLQEAGSELKKSGPQLEEAQKGVDQLMQGTQEANDGVGDMKEALSRIQQGIQSGSQGAGEIKANLQKIKDNLDKSIAGNKKLLQGYQAIADGLKGVGGGNQAGQDIEALKSALEAVSGQLQASLDQLEALQDSEPELDNEQKKQLRTAIQQTKRAQAVIKRLQNELNQVQGAQTGLQDVHSQFDKLNQGFADSIAGQEKLSAGIGKLIAGIEELQSGLNQAEEGQGKIVNNIPSLQEGLSQIYGGQKELKTAFSDMQGQLDQLAGGLNDSSKGLKKIDDGLGEVQDHLKELDTNSSEPMAIIPEEALNNRDFIEGTKPYLSEDKTIVQFDVVLSHNPYSTEAIHAVDQIRDTANDAKEDTIFADHEPELGGVSSTNNDLQNISDADYSRTVLLMIAGLFIILVILLRSLIMPLYLIGSLSLTYFASMGVAELVFSEWLGYDGLTWAIPFFAFVMLMALGIDYSIFLMDRFNEYRNGNIKEALLSAMKNMGTVIISAAIILGGTFGAMLPSGVLSLLQIATVVLTGLFLYAFVMLPLFTPVMVRIFGRANWWPFQHRKKGNETGDDNPSYQQIQ